MLNLLSEQNKNALRHEILSRIFYVAAFFIVIWGLVLGMVIFASVRYLNIQNDALNNSIADINSLKEAREAEELEGQINRLNLLLSKITNIKNEKVYDAPLILERIADTMPRGSNIEFIAYTAADGKITLRGNADLRSQVIFLQKALEQDSLIAEVESPLSNLLKAEDIDFSFILNLNAKNDSQ